MYFIIILLILVFMLICYKIENYSCSNRDQPLNMHKLYAYNDIENILKNYKPRSDVLHRSNPYYKLLIIIDKIFKPIPINLHKLNITYSKINNKLIKDKSKEIINKINKEIKNYSQINKKINKCNTRKINKLPPINFKLHSLTNKRAYLIKDSFTQHNNKIYTIYALTIYNNKNKYSNFLIFNIHLIGSQIANVKYMTIISTDKYYLNSAYDSNFLNFKDYNTTNYDDELLLDIEESNYLSDNDLLNINNKKLSKHIKNAKNIEKKLITKIEENI